MIEHWTGESDYIKGSSKKFEKIEKFIKIDEQGQKVQGSFLQLSGQNTK